MLPTIISLSLFMSIASFNPCCNSIAIQSQFNHNSMPMQFISNHTQFALSSPSLTMNHTSCPLNETLMVWAVHFQNCAMKPIGTRDDHLLYIETSNYSKTFGARHSSRRGIESTLTKCPHFRRRCRPKCPLGSSSETKFRSRVAPSTTTTNHT